MSLGNLFGSKKLVAIDIGSTGIKLAEFDFSARGPVLKKFSVQPIGPGSINAGDIVEITTVGEAISSLVKASKSKRTLAATGMCGNSVIIKKITMPKMEESLVAEQIKWEAEQYIPFDINEISLEHHVLQGRSGSEAMEVLLVAAKQDFLFRIIEAVETGGLKCSLIDVAGFALANCFEANYGTFDESIALLNIGASATNFVVMDRGEVVFCRDIPVGGLNFTGDISKAMGISFNEAEALKISASLGQEVPDEVNGIINSTNEQVVDEIRNSFEFFKATSTGSSITRLFVSGGSIYAPGLIDALSRSIGLPYEVMDPFRRIAYDTKAFTPDYIEQIKAISPIALGLALRKYSDR